MQQPVSHLLYNIASSVHKTSCILVRPSQCSHWLELSKHHHTYTIGCLTASKSRNVQHLVYLYEWQQQTAQTLTTTHLRPLAHPHQKGKFYSRIYASRLKMRDRAPCPMKMGIASNGQPSSTFSVLRNAQIFWYGSKKPMEAFWWTFVWETLASPDTVGKKISGRCPISQVL